jgi:hypothetical protein
MGNVLGMRWARKSIAMMSPETLVKADTKIVETVFIAPIKKMELKDLHLASVSVVDLKIETEMEVEKEVMEEAEKEKEKETPQQETTAPVPEKKDPFRMDWYQNNATVTVEFFIKQLAPGCAEVDIDGAEVLFTIKIGEGR